MTKPKALADLIKERLSIQEVVGQYVQLRQRGGRFFGLCPFHQEKTPSFTVNLDKQYFYCFGCKKTGDVISFYMAIENIPFMEALEELAKRAGILEAFNAIKCDFKSGITYKDNVPFFERVLEFYEKVMHHAALGSPARNYVIGRGVRRETLSLFELGFSPKNPRFLPEFLKKQGLSLDVACDLGLLSSSVSGDFRDPFAFRLVFPIRNESKVLVGFGGRALLTEQLPKYLNTRETKIFKKGQLLYGLHLANRAIRENDSVIVVEGYMDEISLFQAGVKNVVATLGVALSKDHLNRLAKKATNILLSFDGDKAGVNALLRSFKLFLELGFWGYAMILPKGQDPDSYIRSEGSEAFLEAFSKKIPIIDHYIQLRLKDFVYSDENKLSFIKEFRELLSVCPDNLYRSFLWECFKDKTGFVPQSYILPKLKNDNRLKDTFKSLFYLEPHVLLLSFLIYNPVYIARVKRIQGIFNFVKDLRVLRLWEVIGVKLAEHEFIKGKNGLSNWEIIKTSPEMLQSGDYMINFIERLQCLPYGSIAKQKQDYIYEELLERISRSACKARSELLTMRIKEAEQQKNFIALKELLEEKRRLITSFNQQRKR